MVWRGDLKDMRYKLNFKGFFDTRENLFGHTVTEAVTDVDFNSVDNILSECLANIKNKLGITISKNSIDGIQFINQNRFAAQVLISGQDRYLLLINPNKLNSEDELISTIYHELCHVYQLNKLFTEKLMAYDYLVNDIYAPNEEARDLLLEHLNTNGGHTKYWQELTDKINSIIQPNKKITAYLTEALNVVKAELFDEDYFRLNFDGFFDTRESLFGEENI